MWVCVCVCIQNWVTLLNSRNKHKIINQLYFNLKKRKLCLISPGDQFVFSALRGTILCQHSKPVFKRVEATEKAFITSLSQRPSCPTSAEQQSCWDMEHFIRWQKLKSLWWQKSAFFLHKLINYKCAYQRNTNLSWKICKYDITDSY